MRFFYHYNRPMTNRSGRPKISLHFRGECHLVDHIHVNVPTWDRTQERQPRFVMVGEAKSIEIEDGHATIS